MTKSYLQKNFDKGGWFFWTLHLSFCLSITYLVVIILN
jgi:hypothetical protein